MKEESFHFFPVCSLQLGMRRTELY